MSNEQENNEIEVPEPTPTEATHAEGTADSQAETASAPDRSEDDGRTGVASASAQPDASERAIDAVRAARKVRDGVVTSSAMDKTAVVSVVERVRHPKYNKTVLQTKKLHAHDEANDVNVGDRVRVMETRPLSKNKRWRIVEVLERAK
jgi:small subunit ribosomal protein S17